MTKVFNKRNAKRITAILLAVIAVVSSILIIPANAAGKEVTITFDYCYDTGDNIITFVKYTEHGGYTVGTVGEELCRIYADGKDAYCLEPGHSLYSGNPLTTDASAAWNALSKAQKKAINLGLFATEELVSASGTSIPADGLIEIITLDENGNGYVNTDLPFGSYYVKELATDEHYILTDGKFPVVFEYEGENTKTVDLTVNDGEPITNELIYGTVSGKKIDENGEALGGAVIGLFKSADAEFTAENATLTTESAEDGSFTFGEDTIPYGTWYVREIEQPTGFVLNDTVYPVTIGKDGDVVEIEIVNEHIRGNVKTTKVDADYPDNKLTGAVFEIYSDTNADGKLDKDDKLLGEIKETDTGIYEMDDLVYGHYLVKEKKAPDGFILDENTYPVFIETDGKTYDVENDAGKGFLNEAMKQRQTCCRSKTYNKIRR